MNILWVIGNGFDLNIGLKTGYRDFMKRYYMPQSTPELRKALNKAISLDDFGDFENKDRWSDLEFLLGRVTVRFLDNGQPNYDLFRRIFVEMETLFVQYVSEQATRFKDDMISDEDLSEFRSSLLDFGSRFVDADKARLGDYRSSREHIAYDIINLNYTAVFDSYLYSIVESSAISPNNGNPMLGRRGVGFFDTLGRLLHPHGTSEGNNQIIFGVSDSAQITSSEFLRVPYFEQYYLKQQRNDSYGNSNNTDLSDMISKASIFCVYGCSFGETDRYIWCDIGQRILSNPNSRLVMFSKSLPDRSNHSTLHSYLKERDELIERIVSNLTYSIDPGAGIDQEQLTKLKSQIIIANSSDIFKLKPQLLNDFEYPENNEIVDTLSRYYV